MHGRQQDVLGLLLGYFIEFFLVFENHRADFPLEFAFHEIHQLLFGFVFGQPCYPLQIGLGLSDELGVLVGLLTDIFKLFSGFALIRLDELFLFLQIVGRLLERLFFGVQEILALANLVALLLQIGFQLILE